MKRESISSTYHEIVHIQRQLDSVSFKHWLNVSLFSGYWWGLLIATVLCWTVFCIKHDRNRAYPAVLIMLISIIVFGMIDGEFTSSATLIYIVRLQPIRYPCIPISLSFIPVASALTYQYYKRWRTYTGMSFVLSLCVIAIYKCILLPFHMVIFLENVPLYMGVGSFMTFLFSRYVTDKIMKLHHTYQETGEDS